MSHSCQILSPYYHGCHIHGFLSTINHQMPRNRNPLVECCSSTSLSLLPSSPSSSPLMVKSCAELSSVLQGARECHSRREYSKLVMPTRYYTRKSPTPEYKRYHGRGIQRSSSTHTPPHTRGGRRVSRPHSVVGDRYPWVYAVPSTYNLSDDLRKAGIGVCLRGNKEQAKLGVPHSEIQVELD